MSAVPKNWCLLARHLLLWPEPMGPYSQVCMPVRKALYSCVRGKGSGWWKLDGPWHKWPYAAGSGGSDRAGALTPWDSLEGLPYMLWPPWAALKWRSRTYIALTSSCCAAQACLWSFSHSWGAHWAGGCPAGVAVHPLPQQA